MKVLVVGSGGREHALIWKIYQSEKVDRIFVAPGNDGMTDLAERVEIAADDLQALADWAKKNQIDLTVVGPEKPLVDGIVDEFIARGLRIFGPTKDAARIEGSKVFAKSILKKYNIPTAEFEVFTEPDEALLYLDHARYPLVIKAEGLAGGKGVVIATNKEKACEAVDKIMADRLFGDAGNRIVIEDFLEGEEISILALTDGRKILPLSPARDYKAVFDGNEGPNTGGMGAYSPVPYLDERKLEEICQQILEPALKAFRSEGIKYQGILYAGLILTDTGPKVLEFNARLGDPESQVILPRLENDLVDLMWKVIDEKLDQVKLVWDERAAACVVLASGGYPFAYDTGMVIEGLEELKKYDHVLVFHGGTRKAGNHYLTAGGRVLSITLLANNLYDASSQLYEIIGDVFFEDMHYRTDICFDIFE